MSRPPGHPYRARRRRLSALLGTVVLCLLSVLPVALAPAAGATARPRTAPQPAGSAVTVVLNAMSPRSPDPIDGAALPVTFDVTVTNNTDNTYSDVELSIQRGASIGRQELLDSAIKQPPPTTELTVKNPLALTAPLLPRQTLTLSYRVPTDDLCLCFDGVYPYALVVRGVSDPSVGATELGRQQVLIPSFIDQPRPVQVAWVWPLLEVPHRWMDTDVFTDEQLAGSVGPGGRLDRALRTAELLAGQVRLTLLVDPDLLDSLAVMAGPGGYRVRAGTGTVPGTGGQLAAGWLARLKQLRARHDIVLTAFADPDINAVTRAGLKFSTALEPQVQARIAPTLNGDFSSDLLTWPVGSALTGRALDALVGGGASTVLLSDAALPGQNHAEPRPDALSPLPSAAGQATALVTDSGIQATVSRALRPGTSAANDQQTLLSQLAIRAAQQPERNHFVVVTPDRYVDTDPETAAQTILAERGSTWGRAIAVRTALHTVRPVDRGALQTNAENPAAELRPSDMAALNRVWQQVGSMNEALHDNDAAAALLGGFNNGIQRAESSAWRRNRAGGAAITRNLQTRINQLTSAVHLVQPAVGTYSLSSVDSPVVVTVSNELPRAVTVQVAVSPANGVVGFRSPPVQQQTIPARSIATIRIPTHVDRLGKFQVVALLRTPDGRQLGPGVTLNLRATSIGTVTKAITVVAVSVLVLALLRRVVRRIRHSPRRAAAGAAS
ncbi:hypothetical protein [Jatrophihabitans sp.]|uniref:hypothetical protein n=1 Tax=Jatrophihabitans sp. TaxID=1932789 RepID=UPI002CE8AE87|nr:hypothetical protein [Jatrophihabitans sp.]